MKLVPLRASVFLLAYSLVACSVDHTENVGLSEQAGHFEVFTEAELQALEGKQTVIAEHSQTTQSVIVSLSLISRYQKEALIKAIIEADSDVLIVVPKEFTDGLDNTIFEPLKGLLKTSIEERVSSAACLFWL